MNPTNLSVALLIFFSVGCQSTKSSDTSGIVCEGTTDTSHPRKPGSGFVFDMSESTQVIPAQADVLQISATWFDIEQERGVYNWETPKIRHALDAAAACGRKVGLRIASSWSGYPLPIPQWLVDAGVPLYAPDPDWVAEADGRDQLFEPAWWSPIYIEAYRDFVKAYGERFDGDPLIEWVDMRYYGFWGEGHRWGSQEPWPAATDKRALLASFIDMYAGAFKTTPLLVNLASDQGAQYPAGTAIDHGLALGAWMRRDGFGSYISAAESQLMGAHAGVPIIAEPGRAYNEYLAGSVPNFSVDALFAEMFAHQVTSITMGWGDQDWRALLTARPDLVAAAQDHMRSADR